jgi:hypothetical protein
MHFCDPPTLSIDFCDPDHIALVDPTISMLLSHLRETAIEMFIIPAETDLRPNVRLTLRYCFAPTDLISKQFPIQIAKTGA